MCRGVGMTTFNHQCKHQDGCWIATNAAPFGLLQDCFGGKIRPTDIDGVVERNGEFLFFEWKRNYIPLPTGQRILFERLSAKPGITVFVVWHDTDAPGSITKAGLFKNGRYKGEKETDLTGLRKACSQWFEDAETRYGRIRV